MDGERRPGVNQATLRGWKRLAASLVLLPGLSAVGAEMLHLLGSARAEERVAVAADSGKVAAAKKLMREAHAAFDRGDYEKAEDLAETVKVMNVNLPSGADSPEKLLAAIHRKAGDNSTREMPVTREDPRLLVKKAREALDGGRLDSAQDLARQAEANGRDTSWGLFEDDPASILKDVQKARSKRDRGESNRLLTQARMLFEKRPASEEQRAANLDKARSLCLQAAHLHGPYSIWDMGDRPQSLIKDIDSERSKLKAAVRRPAPKLKENDPNALAAKMKAPTKRADPVDPGADPDDFDANPNPKASGYNPINSKDRSVAKTTDVNANPNSTASGYNLINPNDRRVSKPVDVNSDPNPNASGYNLINPNDRRVSKMKPVEGLADANSPSTGYNPIKADGGPYNLVPTNPKTMTRGTEESPELVLPPVSNDSPALAAKPENPDKLRKAEAVKGMIQAQNMQKEGKYFEAYKLLIQVQKQNVAFGPEDETPEMALQSLIASAQKRIDRLCNEAHEQMLKKTANELAAATAKLAEAEAIASSLGLDRWAIGEHKVTLNAIQSKIALSVNINTPDRTEASIPEVVAPPVDKIGGSSPVDSTPPKQVDPGLEMLAQAHEEIRANSLDSARRIVVQVLNGPYACKDQAQALLRTIDAEELALRKNAALVAYQRGLEAYQSHNYEQSLSLFKQIDTTLLPTQKRSSLTTYMATASTAVNKSHNVQQASSSSAVAETSLPMDKGGADSLLKQQEAMMELQFQKFRSEGLQIESAATARFGKGETDVALQDLNNFIVRVKSSNLDPAKVALLTRPIESRIERLKVLKHQQDFLTKEARDLRDFRGGMSQEALHSAHKKEEVAKLMKEFHRLTEEGKYQDAGMVAMKARELDPDDPATQAAMSVARSMYRLKAWNDGRANTEEWNWKTGQEIFDLGAPVSNKEPILYDKERFNQIKNRTDISSGVNQMRSKTEKERQIESKLNTQMISINFKGTPLDEVVAYMQTYSGLNFDLDTKSLQNDGIDPKTPIDSTLNQMTLKSALEVVLAKANLRYVVEKEWIKVTTQKGSKAAMQRRTIPVADLVIPVQNFTPSAISDLDIQLQKSSEHGQSNVPGSFTTPYTPKMGLNGGMGSPLGTPSLSTTPGGRLANSTSGSGVTKTMPTGTIEESLIHLITSSVAPDTWEAMGGPGRIEYYPLGMALVINQTPDVIEEVNRLLESLRQLQDLEIAIEVRMITLAESFYERIGLDFSMNLSTHNQNALLNLASSNNPFNNLSNVQAAGGNHVIGLQLPGVPTPDLNIPIKATSFGMAIPPFGGFPNTPGMDGGISLGLAFLSDIQVQMFLEAAQGDRRTNVMQAPKLTMFNGQSANIRIQDQQFFMTGITVTTINGQLVFTPDNTPFPLGVSMNMQPVVSGDRRFVRLNITQSMTNLASANVPLFPITTIVTPIFDGGGQGQPVPFTQYLQQPTFTTITVNTTVMVPDGGTVLLGGLKTLSEGRNEFGPPVLSKIPYINRLFRNVGYGRDAQSLMMMVTPRIIINREEQEKQTGVVDTPQE